jgi:hypothetical protein
MSTSIAEHDKWAADQLARHQGDYKPGTKAPIDRRAKDALWHLAGLWARLMYVLIILNLIFWGAWIAITGAVLLSVATGGGINGGYHH